MKKPKLSPTFQGTFQAVERLLDEQGRSPSIEELAVDLSLSKATVHSHLASLIDQNFLRKTVGRVRSLEVVRHQLAEMGSWKDRCRVDRWRSHGQKVFIQSKRF